MAVGTSANAEDQRLSVDFRALRPVPPGALTCVPDSAAALPWPAVCNSTRIYPKSQRDPCASTRAHRTLLGDGLASETSSWCVAQATYLLDCFSLATGSSDRGSDLSRLCAVILQHCRCEQEFDGLDSAVLVWTRCVHHGSSNLLIRLADSI